MRDVIKRIGSGHKQIILDGPGASGKSAAAILIAEACLQVKARPVLFMNLISKWTAGYYPYRPSSSDPHCYEQPELACEIIQTFKLLNPGVAFEDVTELINASPGEASKHLETFLNSLPSNTVLIADEFNALLGDIAYRTVESKLMALENLPILSLIKNTLFSSPLQRVLVCSTSGPTFDDTDPSESVQIPYFSSPEIFTLLKYYEAVNFSPREITFKYAEKIRFVSGGKGTKILDSLTYDAIFRR